MDVAVEMSVAVWPRAVGLVPREGALQRGVGGVERRSGVNPYPWPYRDSSPFYALDTAVLSGTKGKQHRQHSVRFWCVSLTSEQWSSAMDGKPVSRPGVRGWRAERPAVVQGNRVRWRRRTGGLDSTATDVLPLAE